MFFPSFIDSMQDDRFLECFRDSFAFCFVSFFQVAGNIIHTFTVRNRDHDVFIHRTLMFVNLFDHRIGNLSHTFHAAFEQLQRFIEQFIGQLVGFAVLEFFFRERTFHCESLEQFQLETFVVTIGMLVDDCNGCIINCI